MPMPNTVLMATDSTATYTVRRKAWTTSGSSKIARRSVKPSANVFFATSDTGQATSRNR